MIVLWAARETSSNVPNGALVQNNNKIPRHHYCNHRLSRHVGRAQILSFSLLLGVVQTTVGIHALLACSCCFNLRVSYLPFHPIRSTTHHSLFVLDPLHLLLQDSKKSLSFHNQISPLKLWPASSCLLRVLRECCDSQFFTVDGGCLSSRMPGSSIVFVSRTSSPYRVQPLCDTFSLRLISRSSRDRRYRSSQC